MDEGSEWMALYVASSMTTPICTKGANNKPAQEEAPVCLPGQPWAPPEMQAFGGVGLL